ncbi:putative zinc transporter At3g08650 isoform X2 [Musa acuminata AAA Group]|uniref:putative zinc transporter At3g08650 isoform X2 n=1 Tax=Musa acuminata AAA Group TaxID=214697 RepID=UPI0031CE1AC6
MASLCRGLLVVLLVSVFLNASCIAESEKAIVKRIRTAPQRNLENVVIDGTGKIAGFDSSEGSFQGFDDRRVGNSRVSVSTVAWLTLAMAAATGLGSVPFFFVELEPQYAGVCNGLAAGVMLAASFDLIQEGQIYGSGNWVVLGILAGGIFILLCKKFLEQYGEVSMLDIKGADASKVILVVGIMTLHSFGEGSGVGVSFAGPKGLSQGLLVTLAIAVHNIPEGLAVSMVLASRGVSPHNAMLWSVITSLPQPIVAVPSFLCADTFHKVLPFCTGFAAGCMIWMVIAEVLPDAFKEAVPSQVASAGTLAVAFMETLSTVLQGFSHGHSSEDTSGFLVSLLFGLGPLLGGIILVAFALAFYLQHSLLIAGSAFYHMATACIPRLVRRRKASVNDIAFSSGFSISAITLQSFFACGAISLHALAEGLALGVAAPKAYGLGRHMVLPVSLHGLPRGAAVASCIFGATDSWRGALAASALTGLAGPTSAIGAILAGIDYNGLDYWMVFACGALVPSFGRILLRALRLEARKSTYGFLMGLGFASLCLMSTRLVCLHTPYCNSAPEAVT